MLDKNDLGNDGVRELANGLIERFNSMERENNGILDTDQGHNLMTDYIQMPVQSLSISNTALTDFGFKYLLQRIENIYIR